MPSRRGDGCLSGDVSGLTDRRRLATVTAHSAPSSPTGPDRALLAARIVLECGGGPSSDEPPPPSKRSLLSGHRDAVALPRGDQVVVIVRPQVDLDPVHRTAEGVA